MSDIKQGFGSASQSIACSVDNLYINGEQWSAFIDNTTNKFLDASIFMRIVVTSGTLSYQGRINVWFYASEDGTNPTSRVDGTDSGVASQGAAHQYYGPFVIQINTTNRAYFAVIPSVAEYFGGVLPPKWGIIIDNQTGISFGTSSVVNYRGLFQKIV